MLVFVIYKINKTLCGRQIMASKVCSCPNPQTCEFYLYLKKKRSLQVWFRILRLCWIIEWVLNANTVSLKEVRHTDIWRKRQFGEIKASRPGIWAGRGTDFSLGATRGSKACHHSDFGLSAFRTLMKFLFWVTKFVVICYSSPRN